ncbi:MAG: hypothetical protein KDE53_33890 [Caldilineaceae bacterium]|nr:hypothetical protein [Caldilineaceae bacterium]
MEDRTLQIVIAILTGFIALTAIGGGIALLVGLEDARFPLEWLRGTPFTDYTIPALLLAIVVGGSALVACVTIILGHGWGVLASIVAGVIMMGYIVVEYLILKQSPPGPTVTEYGYFALGLVTFVLAGYIWLAERTLMG